MKSAFQVVSRCLGLIAGAIFLIEAIVEPLGIPMTIVTAIAGLLLIAPWSIIRNPFIWWPAYTVLSAILMLLVVHQIRALGTRMPPSIADILWIAVELTQPIALWTMKCKPEQAGSGCPSQGAGSSAP